MIVRQGDVTGPSSAKRNTILQLALTRSDQCPTQGPLARGLARSVLRRSAGFLAESINRSARWMSRRCSGRSLAAVGRRGRGSATATRTADACCGSPCDDDRVIHECRRDGNAAGGFAPKAFLSEFVGGLHPQPEPRAGLARGFHPQGEDGRDGSLLLDYGGQVRALDAELLGGIRNAEGPALAGGGDVVAWVRGVVAPFFNELLEQLGGGRESLRRQRTETCGHPWSLVAVVVDRSSITGATVSEAEDHAQGTRGFDGRGTRVVAGEAVESLREHDLWQFRNVEAFWLLSAGVDAIRIPDRCGLDRFVQPNRTACADSGDQDFDRGRECPRRLPLG